MVHICIKEYRSKIPDLNGTQGRTGKLVLPCNYCAKARGFVTSRRLMTCVPIRALPLADARELAETAARVSFGSSGYYERIRGK